MPTDSLRAGRPWTSAGQNDEFLRVRFAVIPGLEASLHRSRKALLALDLAGIERETKEQTGLMRELEAACEPVLGAGRDRKPPPDHGEAVAPVGNPELLEELRRSENRLWEATLLQAALLGRSRHKLRVLANMLAGISTTYGPWFERDRTPAQVFLPNPKGRI